MKLNHIISKGTNAVPRTIKVNFTGVASIVIRIEGNDASTVGHLNVIEMIEHN